MKMKNPGAGFEQHKRFKNIRKQLKYLSSVLVLHLNRTNSFGALRLVVKVNC